MSDRLRWPLVAASQIRSQDAILRRRRWRIFLWLFSLTCLSVVLDLLTTYWGFQRIGPRFEQNAVALYLIEHIGWFGVGAILALACAVCLRSFKMVYWNLGLQWSRWLNLVVATICVFRWLVVVSDFSWLMNR